MTTVRFIRSFRTPGGPLYVPGDVAAVSEQMASEAIRQGAALREQPATYGVEAPPQDKMVTRSTRK